MDSHNVVSFVMFDPLGAILSQAPRSSRDKVAPPTKVPGVAKAKSTVAKSEATSKSRSLSSVPGVAKAKSTVAKAKSTVPGVEGKVKLKASTPSASPLEGHLY